MLSDFMLKVPHEEKSKFKMVDMAGRPSGPIQLIFRAVLTFEFDNS